MDRQKILNNFFSSCDGKGRAYGSSPADTAMKNQCLYFPKNHPGCAIGCQPGFRDAFEGEMEDNGDIRDNWNEGMAEFFDVDVHDDSFVDFLSSLQGFHDNEEHWESDGKISMKWLKMFCDDHKLTCPERR